MAYKAKTQVKGPIPLQTVSGLPCPWREAYVPHERSPRQLTAKA